MTLSEKASAGYTSITLRGGRITKWKGQAASFSPQLGMIVGGVSGTAMATALALAGGSLVPAAALAGDCVSTGPGEFECAGEADPGNDTTQVINENGEVTVRTLPGFGIDSGTGDAFTITGNGDTVFIDSNASDITGDTDGIEIRNDGFGLLEVTANGTITGITQNGISARNTTSGSSITIDVLNVNGNYAGIYALNLGSGSLTISADGLVQANVYDGIEATNNGTDLIINTVDVIAEERGIDASNDGTGRLAITATGSVRGANYSGINAFNGGSGTDLDILAGETSGNYHGINAQQYGSGALTITTTGLASSAFSNAINATSSGQSGGLSITAAGASGGENGIFARNYGDGDLSVTATAPVVGYSSDGINALNGGLGINLSIEATDVEGNRTGIYARNSAAVR